MNQSSKEIISTDHIPVMLREVIEVFSSNFYDKNYSFLDMTFGAGGHSEAILMAYNKSRVYAIDRDIHTEIYAKHLSEKYLNRFVFFNTKFSHINFLVKSGNIGMCDGILFDLGVSSMQLNSKDRGFSFTHNSRLDMRMENNNSTGIDAQYLVNYFTENQLADIIFKYGGEKHSKKIAKAIVAFRMNDPIITTHQLADIIEQTVGKYYSNSKIHPATKTFQAIRIAVNNELSEISIGLQSTIPLLKIGGIMIIISFHSLEDSIVKNEFRKMTKKVKHNKYSIFSQNSSSFDNDKYCKININDPIKMEFVNIFKKALTPGRDELITNRRSRSAKMRAIQRIR